MKLSKIKILNSVGVNFADTIIVLNTIIFMIKKNEEFKFGSIFVHQHSREKLRKNNPQLWNEYPIYLLHGPIKSAKCKAANVFLSAELVLDLLDVLLDQLVDSVHLLLCLILENMIKNHIVFCYHITIVGKEKEFFSIIVGDLFGYLRKFVQ